MQMSEKKLSNSIYHATKWSAITNIMRKMISPITNMILARLLAPDAFGVVATINMVISFAEMFSDAGFHKFLVQYEFKDDEEMKKSANVAFWTNLGISVFLWILIAIWRNPLAELVGSPGYGIHLMVAALAIPLVSFSSIQQAIFRRQFDFKGMFLPRLINSLVPLVVTVPLAYFTRSCWALILGALVANLSDATLLTIKSRWKPMLFYRLDELKKMFSFSVWSMIESISIWLTINIDIFILGQMLSSYYLGLYKVSITSVNQIITMVTTTIVPVLFASLSRCQDNKSMFEGTFYSFQKNVAIILIPMSLGILVYSDVVTWILLGEQWMEATLFIGLIGLMQAGTVLYANFASEVYRAKGEPKISVLVQLAYIACIIPGVIWGAGKSFSVLCITRSLLMIVFILIHIVVLKKRYKLSVRVMLHNVSRPMVASVAMGFVGIVLNYFLESMILKALSIIVCVIVYFMVCLIFKETRLVVMGVVKKVLKR